METMDTASEQFPHMRRKDRALSQEMAIHILEEGEFGVLSTCGKDGWPYGVPLSYVYREGKLYFHGAATGHKLDNLRFCPKASFTVTAHTHVLQERFSTAYQSAIAFGIVQAVSAEDKKEVMMLLAEKYCYSNLQNAALYVEKMLSHVGVFCLEIVHLTGKSRVDAK
jgi:nitroimidazol reductase NimA-like FMN-containing flavoprotein (pyridoxamine 5'-phosphate oxidase superfamily)